jgi:hypothetical protein
MEPDRAQFNCAIIRAQQIGGSWLNRLTDPCSLPSVQLIASTTTESGLTVACHLDGNDYAKGIKVTDAEMSALNIQPAAFHGEWNYTIAPRRPDG